MEDASIIELYFDRDEDAIRQTDIKYGSYCNTITYNILHDYHDSEECRNDTYFKLWNTIPPTRPNHFKAFIARIARNLAIDMYDKKHADKRGGAAVELALDELEECLGASSNPYEAEDQVVTDCLNAFLRTLSEEARFMFVRRYWYMDTTVQIAELMKIKESKVRVTLKRTRDRLRSFLAKEGIRI